MVHAPHHHTARPVCDCMLLPQTTACRNLCLVLPAVCLLAITMPQEGDQQGFISPPCLPTHEQRHMVTALTAAQALAVPTTMSGHHGTEYVCVCVAYRQPQPDDSHMSGVHGLKFDHSRASA